MSRMSTKPKTSERPCPPEGRCHYFVERKRRYCRFHPTKTSNYCAEHILLYEPDNGKKRVLCPYNIKHTCYENRLRHHMKKCPSRPMQMPPYYSEGINAGDNDGEIVPDPKASVVTEELGVLENIIEKVEQLHKQHIGKLEEDILSHPCLQSELDQKGYGNSALRQRKQQASLIGQMEQMGMLKDGTCFLEMGAGKGQMSHWLHGAVEDRKDIGFVLIERSHVRNKMDNLHKEEEAGHVMERVKIDIEHLKLDKIPTFEKHERHVVAFGKHLCGGATDLALRCVVETLPNSSTVNTQGNEESQNKRLKSDIKSLSGVAIAVCCHHRCSWTPYVGKTFFKSCGFTAKDFQIISNMSSWATCAWKGWSHQRKMEKEKINDKDKLANENEEPKADIGHDDLSISGVDVKLEVDNHDMAGGKETNITGVVDESLVHSETAGDLNRPSLFKGNKHAADTSNKPTVSEVNEVKHEVKDNVITDKESVEDIDDDSHTPAENFTNTRIQEKLSKAQREKIGRKCKQLIDYGRVQYLKDHDMSSCLKIYIEEFYTPENVVLLATS